MGISAKAFTSKRIKNSTVNSRKRKFCQILRKKRRKFLFEKGKLSNKLFLQIFRELNSIKCKKFENNRFCDTIRQQIFLRLKNKEFDETLCILGF